MAYLGQRARVVALHAGVDAGEARLRLGRDYAAVGALQRYGRVTLWFEHDLWDQAALIRVLSLQAGRRGLEGKLFLAPADGRRPFVELSEAELRALRPAPLTPREIECGAEAWSAFAAPDPTALDALSRQALPLPHLAAAMRRHLQDLPWRSDGLALTERQLLRAVAGGAGDVSAVMAAQHAMDAVFPQTGLMVLALHRRLSEAPRPLLTRGSPWRLTPFGEAVLTGEARHRPPPRSQAGVVVGPDPAWLWDPARAGVAPA
jgi:hypothetical protein